MHRRFRPSAILSLLGLAALLSAEYAASWRAAECPHASIYPRWYDQVQYLNEAYSSFEYAAAHGWGAGIIEGLAGNAPQGALHDVLPLPFMMVHGPGRVAALSVNALALIALQLATFFGMRSLLGTSVFGWIAVGLIAALRGLFNESGSMLDYRLDWMASCAFGVALAACVATRGFLSTGWSAAFGASVGCAVLIRFITATYFGIVFVLLAFGLLLAERERGKRLARFLLAGVLAALVAGPALWSSRAAIHDYYWVGHVVGPELALRDSHLGLPGAVLWLADQLFRQQFGPYALGLGGLSIGTCFLLCHVGGRPSTAESLANRRADLPAWWIAGAFFVAPAAVLLGHPVKAPQPVSILIAPTVWLIALVCGSFAERAEPRRLWPVGVAAGAAGAVLFAVGLLRAAPTAETVRDAARLNALVDYLCYRVQETDVARPRVAVSHISPALNASCFGTLAYERHGRLLDFEQMLPTGLYAVDEKTVFERLATSDYVLLASDDAGAAWPFDRSVTPQLPAMRAWCDTHLARAGSLTLLGRTISVYERGKSPAGGGAVELSSLLASAGHAAPLGAPRPPSPPRFVKAPARVLWSTQGPGMCRFPVAYTPLELTARGLPAGLRFDARSGVIEGQPATPGTWEVVLTAQNAAGSTEHKVCIHAEDRPCFAEIDLPGEGRVERPVTLRFQVVDTKARLDFIDVTVSPEGKLLDRLTALESQRARWTGEYLWTPGRPGRHALALRFVRFDPSQAEPYSFHDEVREIEVVP